MRVMRSIPELGGVSGPVFLAIGVFDGVHLGHQALIRRCLEDARTADGTPVVVTFDPHPVKVLQADAAPRVLTATQHKTELIGQLGIRHLLVIDFTLAFAATPPEIFIRELAAHSHPLAEICVGHSWSFGARRAGNLALLQRLGQELGFCTAGIADVLENGEPVSSTRIRRLIAAGELAETARLLGREYTILGTVEPGERVGRSLGFPTANLSAHNELFPPSGVYAVAVRRGTGTLPGVANIGTRPTVSGLTRPRSLEVHLLDFEGDLYGEELEVRFVQHLREERKFSGLDALRGQIAHDITQARRVLAAAG